MILGIATGVSLSLTAGLLANRGGYMTGFRSHDVNFAIQLNLSKVVAGEACKAHRQNGKAWLRLSEDYRHAALFLTFAVVYQGFATIFFLVSTLFDFILGGVFYLFFAVPSVLFLWLMIMSQIIRYRRLFRLESPSVRLRNLTREYIRVSFRLASSRFLQVINPEHIARHPHIYEHFIEPNPDISEYLQEIDYASYLWLIPTKWPGPYKPDPFED